MAQLHMRTGIFALAATAALLLAACGDDDDATSGASATTAAAAATTAPSDASGGGYGAPATTVAPAPAAGGTTVGLADLAGGQALVNSEGFAVVRSAEVIRVGGLRRRRERGRRHTGERRARALALRSGCAR